LLSLKSYLTWFGLVKTNWNRFSSNGSIMPTTSESEAQ